MKKFVVKLFLYSTIAIFFFNAIAVLSLYCLKNSSFYKPQFLYHEVNEPKFDYIIIGSSIGLTGLDTQLIDSICNKKGLNLCIDDTSLSSNYLMLQHYYAQNKKVDYCIVAVSSWDLANKNPAISNNDYRFLPFVNRNYVYQYYKGLEKRFFKPLTFSHYLPAFGVAYYNTEIFYPSIIAAIRPNKKNRFDDKGNYCYPESGALETKPQTQKTLQWNNPYLHKIKNLCNKNNTKLIVYQSPLYNVLLKNNNNQYCLINHCNKLPEKQFFYDAIHVNSLGRKSASVFFANDFSEFLGKK